MNDSSIERMTSLIFVEDTCSEYVGEGEYPRAKLAFPKSNKIVELGLESFTKMLDELIYSSLDERNKNGFIIPIRKKMAPFAAVKTRWVLRKIKPKRILISPFSLKEGVLA